MVFKKYESGYEMLIQTLQIANNGVVISILERNNKEMDWKIVDLSLGVNYKIENFGEETWLSLRKGELINEIE